ncbi:MAG: hypothetical protein KAI95_16195, partial [Bacteroidales bacterium]|nr:hypothetical protein [Bacteroidales bacterium]
LVQRFEAKQLSIARYIFGSLLFSAIFFACESIVPEFTLFISEFSGNPWKCWMQINPGLFISVTATEGTLSESLTSLD